MLTETDIQNPATPEPSRGSVWVPLQDGVGFPALAADLSVDAVVIGGGIAGVSAAAALADAGRTVALLEASHIGLGTTGHATGNLYATVDESLHRLREKWGSDNVSAVVRSRWQAIDSIESRIVRHRIKCDFKRQPWALYSIDGLPDEIAHIEAEYEAALAAGLDARLALDLPLPYMTRKAMVIPDQAQFNPFQYVRQLAAAIDKPQCRLFEGSAVTAIDEEKGVVATASHTVRADHIVIATHTPKGVSLLQAELGAYREYAVAAELENPALAGGIFWGLGASPTSTRMAMVDGKPHVLLIGEKHKTGQDDNTEGAYQRLEGLLRARFKVDAPDYRWSAQHYRAADSLPYIGSTANAPNVYIATGFGADGLTYGTLAGMLIADEICGTENAFAELYSPRRFTPVKSAVNFLKENLNVAGCYIKDYAQSAVLKGFGKLRRDEGGLVEVAGEKLAAYRDNDDRLHVLSPVCTHLKCIVHWNRAERSWDCPCHGSRFRVDGTVIEGPALQPLVRRDGMKDEGEREGKAS